MLGCCVCYPHASTIKEIIKNEPFHTFEDLHEDIVRDRKQYAVKLSINSTGILSIDPNVLHPFVRVHIVDLETKKYLAKDDAKQPGVANKESVNYFKVPQVVGAAGDG